MYFSPPIKPLVTTYNCTLKIVHRFLQIIKNTRKRKNKFMSVKFPLKFQSFQVITWIHCNALMCASDSINSLTIHESRDDHCNCLIGFLISMVCLDITSSH